MLQQTTVAAVGPYFHNFLKRWPTMKALAAAPVEEVMSAWAGLGYYSRARNLHACAQSGRVRHGGEMPSTEAATARTPGHRPLHGGRHRRDRVRQTRGSRRRQYRTRSGAPLRRARSRCPARRRELRAIAESLAPEKRAGDFAQAMMDLGATICTPKSPSCGQLSVGGRLRRPRAKGIAATLAGARRETRSPAETRRRLRADLARRTKSYCAAARRRACWAACTNRR